MNDYRPKPIDTSHVRLPDDILKLSELLAENTHDIWAKKRIEEGWTYGEKRDDTQKTNPCLVPYADLPDREKEYDRCTSRQVLEILYALGYQLVKQ